MAVHTAHRPIPFGERYALTQMLAVGGMAEIYLGYSDVAAGLTKPVVIKRLKPELARDPHIAKMFLDEARLSTMLHHPYVVQIYDVGEEGGVPFIAMEYVRGEELNQLARRGLQAGLFMPRHLAVELVRQAAVALGYCHALRDDAGGALELVHCDVSPNNLLVTEDGFVKLIDFGIARFVGQRHREALVPGKLSYMSPEQVLQRPLDSRSDIFSLGIILYEMTLGRRLFRGPAREMSDKVARADIELPTFLEHEYPGHLEGILMKALERHASDRYQSAYELADDLAQYLVTSGIPVGSVEVARYVDELAEAAGAVPRAELRREADDADDLDFDRDIAQGPPRPALVTDPSAWDDMEEGVDVVAGALGIEPELVRSDGRAPTSDRGLLGGLDEVQPADAADGEEAAASAEGADLDVPEVEDESSSEGGEPAASAASDGSAEGAEADGDDEGGKRRKRPSWVRALWDSLS